MKNLLVLGIALVSLVSVARSALAAPSADPALTTPEIPANVNRFPFNGTAQSTETSVTVFPTMSATATGSGSATQLGAFTIHYQVEISLLDLSSMESFEFTGTYGDSLRAEAVGQATQNRTPGMLNVLDIYKITGGTGRFDGARGTFTLNRLVSLTTGAASNTFEGYLLLPWK
jgi:hypothetical protein